jgi:hypothetical protein
VLDSGSLDTIHIYRAALSLVGGPNHGLLVGVITSCDGQSVEILGSLPAASRKWLKKVAADGVPTRGRIPWRLAKITWCERLNGRGPRYAIPDLAALLELVAERRLRLEGRAV